MSEDSILDEILREEGVADAAPPASAGVPEHSGADDTSVSAPDIDTQREALAILAATGSTKEYLGKHLSLGDVAKLSNKDVQRYHLRYGCVLGKEVERSLSSSFLQIACRVTGRVLAALGKQLDDEQALLADLKQDALIRREFSYGAGWIAVHGGRLVALAAALAHVGSHVQAIEETQQPAHSASDNGGGSHYSTRAISDDGGTSEGP